MANQSRNRKNQPPTGQGKHSPRRGAPQQLAKRSEVIQAHRGRHDLNLGDADEEHAMREGVRPSRGRPKAGR